jgi:hypothetical protein
MQQTVQCYRCGVQNNIGQQCCWNCQVKLPYNCPRCGSPIEPTYINCLNCRETIQWPWRQQLKQQTVQPTIQTSQQQIVPSNNAGGGVRCANCGSAIIPVKSRFGFGWFLLWLVLGGFPAIIYLFYHVGKRSDWCPVCGKHAYHKW